jgi:hypothetical protein
MPTQTPLNAVQNVPLLPTETCLELVETVAKSCAASSERVSEPNWDAMANSFASLSSAFTWGTIILAVIALIGAIAWG